MTIFYDKLNVKPPLTIDVDAIPLPKILNPHVDMEMIAEQINYATIHFYFENYKDKFSIVIEDSYDGDIRVKDIMHSVFVADCPFCDHRKAQNMSEDAEEIDWEEEDEQHGDNPYSYLQFPNDPRLDFSCITESVYKLKFARCVLREVIAMNNEEFNKGFQLLKIKWRLVSNFEISK